MSAADFLQNMKQKVRSAYNNFFYDGEEAPAPVRMQDEPAAPGTESVYQQPVNYQQAASYQQPANYQQPASYQQPANYQQPAAYQYAAPQAAYQPAAPQMEAPQMGTRARRMAQHVNDNVVDLNAYQQFQPASPVQPMEQAMPSVPESVHGTRVINARGMADCRSAITLLREGDAVLIVMENITDPSEMRRLVDTLSGACYSLTATITKVSRGGVYLLAPQAMAVYTDQITNQMNGAVSRAYAQPQAGQPGSYGEQAAPVMAAAPQQGFTQRAAAPAASASFYARPVPQSAPVPDFSERQPANGYRPDEMAAGGY